MKSKQQKMSEVAENRALLEKAASVVFVNFSRTPVSKVNALKVSLREVGSAYKVMKKRLFGVIFKEKNLPIDMDQFESQFAAIFSEKDISDPAGIAHRFAKQLEKEGAGFALIGGADIKTNVVYNAQDIIRIGNLPTRDILLAQLAMMLNAPARQLAYVLDTIGKKK